MEETVSTVGSMFSAEQITAIETALGTAIGNVLNMFVQLLPIVAILSGVAFGVALVRGLFKKASRARS